MKKSQDPIHIKGGGSATFLTPPSHDLKTHAASGMTFTLSAQICKFVLQLASVAILSRLLEPADFGLVAMVMVVTTIMQIIADGGLAAATIQRPAITQAQLSCLFWINLALGVVMALLLAMVAPFIAWLYQEPKLVAICFALAFPFVIAGATVQVAAVMQREMRFRDLALIDVMTMAMGIMTAIACALAGFGYWTLVLMTIASALVRLGSIWMVSEWRPHCIFRNTEGLDEILRFGIHVAAGRAIGAMTNGVTPFAVGLVGGPAILGLYNRAATLSSLPTSQLVPPLMAVAQPVMARVLVDSNRFRRGALSLLTKTCMIGSFLTVTIVACADLLVLTILGPRWEGTIDLLRLLSVFTLVEPMAGVLASLLIATGRADSLFRWRLVSLAIVVGSIGVGSLWGTMGIVAAYSVSGLILRFPAFTFYAAKQLCLSRVDIASSLSPSIMLAVITFGVLVSLRTLFPELTGLPGLVVIGSASMTIFGLGSIGIPAMREHVLDVVGQLKIVVSGQKASSP